MRKYNFIILAFVFILSLAACSQQDETIMPALIPDEISSIEVTHDFYPYEITKELNNDEISIIKEWAAALEWEQTSLGEDETPDNYAGGEAWIFNVNDGEITFTYVYQGVSSAILIDSEWYAVKNPANPPVEIDNTSSVDNKANSGSTDDSSSNETGRSLASFSWENTVSTYKDGDPGVNPNEFVNIDIYPIDNQDTAVERAKNECTIEHNATSEYYDSEADMWRIDFFTIVRNEEGIITTPGNCQSVYLNGDGITQLVVYGE